MKQFSLEEYLKNPQKNVITRAGLPVRIICTDKKGLYHPVIALVEQNNEEVPHMYYENGKYLFLMESDIDLFFASKKKEGWINIYHYNGIGNANASRRIFNTKEEALAGGNKGRIDTIKIEWEE